MKPTPQPGAPPAPAIKLSDLLPPGAAQVKGAGSRPRVIFGMVPLARPGQPSSPTGSGR